MSDILGDIDRKHRAQEKLKRIAKGSGERLTAAEARYIVNHVMWLSDERETLMDSLPED